MTVFDAKDFGAKCDGRTNDIEALRNAESRFAMAPMKSSWSMRPAGAAVERQGGGPVTGGLTITPGGTYEWRPHDGQRAILQSKARFKVAACGRRFGKSELGSIMALQWAHQSTKRNPVWWVAPTYDLCGPGLDACEELYPQSWVESVTTAPGNIAINFVWGGRIDFKSAEKERTLRGRGLCGLLVEEAGEIRDGVWDILRPTLADLQSPAFAFGTPKGRNWFWKLAMRGLEGEDGFETFVNPTSANPFIKPEEIEEARRNTPDRAFRQEWLAEFVADSGGVFSDPRRLVRGDFSGPEPGEVYVIGWDPAKHQDYSAIDVERVRDRHTVLFKRMQKTPYPEQCREVARIAKEYGAPVVLDVTGAGDPVYDMLVELGVEVWPYRFTHSSKQNLINNLALHIGEGSTTWPDIPVLTNELEIYEWKENGRSGAPEGWHDDSVMAKALGVWGVSRGANYLQSRADGGEVKEDLMSLL